MGGGGRPETKFAVKGPYVRVSCMDPCVRGEMCVSEQRLPYAFWSVWECVS